MLKHRSATILGDVPLDWDTVPLGATLLSSASGDWGDDRGEVSVHVLRSTNFTAERKLDFSDVALRGFSADSRLAEIRAGDILVERSGGGPAQPVGRVVRVSADLPGFGFSNFVQLLRVNPEAMSADYVAWTLFQLHRSGLIERLQHQTTQMRNLDFRDYLQMRIPRPPKPEQCAIARRITAADLVVSDLRAQLEAATRLRTSLLQHVFTSGLPGTHDAFEKTVVLRASYDIPASWNFERLGRSLSQVDYGTNMASNDRFGWPVVGIPQVAEGVLARGDWPFVALPRPEAEPLFLAAGDVLLVRTNGNPDYIGRATVVSDALASEEIVFASYLIRARPDEDRLLGRYLNLFLASPLGRRQLLAAANTSAGNHNLVARSIKRIFIPLPPKDEQTEILKRIEGVARYCDTVRTAVLAAEKLRDALLQTLITGQVRITEAAAG